MIFLAFLKALAFIIVLILIIALILLLTVLFAPIRFSLTGDFKDEGKREGALNIRWLFGLVSLKASYKNDKLDFKLKYPFKFIAGGKKAKASKKVKTADKSKKKLTEPKKPEAEKAEPKAGNNLNGSNVKADKKQKPKTKSEKPESKKPKGRLSALKENITAVMSVENKGDIINCFVKNIKQVLKKIKFKVFKADILFGFEDPSLTGEVLGLLCGSGLFFIKGLNIKTDFSRTVFEAETDIKGRGNLFNIIIPAVKFILNKNVRKVIF